MSPRKDMTHQVFSRLTVLKYAGRDKHKRASWLVQCSCGSNAFRVSGTNLRRGYTKSCGCLQRELLAERSKTHGLSETKVYTAYWNLIKRCTNPKYTEYERYGGRGIKVCDKWISGFEAFYRDVGDPPSDRHSIDRIDNDGDYEPGNVRWATHKEQHNNTSSNVRVRIDGVEKTLAEWADLNGLKSRMLQERYRNGWRGDDLLQPRGFRRQRASRHLSTPRVKRSVS